MNYVNTVTGPVAASELGRTLMVYYGGCLQLQPDIHSKRTYQSYVTG